MGLYLTNEGKRLCHITPQSEFWDNFDPNYKPPQYCHGPSKFILKAMEKWREINATKAREKPKDN